MAEEMVLDAGTEVEEPLETGSEGSESSEIGSESTESTETGHETERAEDKPAAQIYKSIKEALKAHDPSALRQVRKALHLMDEVKSKAPDGLGKLVERMEAISQLDDDDEDAEYVPGTRTMEEVIERTLNERNFWRNFDKGFQIANPEVINHMATQNPVAFQRLIPIAFDKFAEINPDGFSALVCKSVDGFLAKSGIPLQMELMARVLPESSTDPAVQTLIDGFSKIKAALGGISAWAQKPIEPKVAAGNETRSADGSAQGATLEDREISVKNVEWTASINPKTNQFAVNEVLRVFGKGKFTAPEVEQLKKSIKQEINGRITMNSGYQKKIKGFLKANNRTAYNMAVESEHKKIISGAIKRLGDDILAKRPTGAKKSVPAQKTTQTGQKTVQQNAQSGDTRFEMIAGAPRTQGLTVDHKRTVRGMLEKNTAYVVGRKAPVKWR